MVEIEVCFTPSLIQHFELKGKTVVVTDIFRASSTIVTALAAGVEHLKPVAEVEACRKLMAEGYLGAAERKGTSLPGFDFTNSPTEILRGAIKGKKLALTTTNGTYAISKSLDADKIVIGAFLNLMALAEFLKKEGKNVIVHCAGWRGHFNLEDSLFAGALIDEIKGKPNGDSSLAALLLYQKAKNNIDGFLKDAGHYQRLIKNGHQKDIPFCLTFSKYDYIPFYKEGILINAD